MRHVQGIQYRLNLILYFDKVNGLRGAKDQQVTVSIFRMADNNRMMTLTMPLTDSAFVNYTSVECTTRELSTQKLIYTALISLTASEFSDPLGYYVSWQRCCRNYVIDNIFSERPTFGNGQPNPNAKFAGQTFYLEFPPVTKNGQPFIDSTPELFPPLSDYGCVGKPYYVDFSGSDVDGDSLVYSLVTPLNTTTSAAIPTNGLPFPKLGQNNSYPNVQWQLGYNLENVMGGTPDLTISQDGLLTVTPAKDGLFVFAVKCEEFRDGVKIGETRRDFQMLVLICPNDVAPVVRGRKLGEPSFSYTNNMTITFPHSIPEEDRCIEIEITDNDIFGNTGEEFVSIKSIIGFGSNRKLLKNETILPSNVSASLNPSNQSVIFKICFDECPPEKNIPYQIGIVVKDDACALPLLDTLRVSVLVETPPNSPAQFIEPVPDVNQSLFEGTSDQWPIQARDVDGDTLTFSFYTDGFTLAGYGMDLDVTKSAINRADGTLTWDAKCDAYDFSLKQNFHIKLVADDSDFCSYNVADTAHVYLKLINPSGDPVIDTDLTPVFSERLADGGIHRIYDNAIQFKLFGTDTDPYPISLEAEGIDFDMSEFNITFPEVTGTTAIQSPFSWTLNCEPFKLAEKDTFAIRFMVIDRNNKCKIYQADTVEVGFKILPPLNKKPSLVIANLNPTNDGLGALTTFWNKPIELLLTGTDADVNPVQDNLTIELVDIESDNSLQGFSFAPALPVTSVSPVSTKFSWLPDCSIFTNNIFNNTYKLTFRVVDDHCESSDADTVGYVVNVKDYVSTDENFIPPNVITPNTDEFNDFFALDGLDLRGNGSDPNDDINLPLDNCTNRFEFINIYNRWGKLMYTSSNRFFRWYAPGAGAGVYYYFLKFTQEEYKGSVLVRY